MKNFCTLICLISLNILCHSVPQFNNFNRGAIKTTAQLKKICETQFEFSRWINDRCYFFYNKEVPSFDDSQKICSDTFKQHGFDNGRVYEPRDPDNFKIVYALAEEFSKRPTLQLWIGLNDKEKDGQFVYNSNGRLPLPRYAFWKYDNSNSQPNGGLAENCVTTFKESKDDYSPSWYDRPCVEENDSFGDVGHKFMCECDVPYQNQNAQPYQGFVKGISPLGNQGGVSGRRGCAGQLSLFQGKRLLETIEVVNPFWESLTLAANENRNNFRIDSIEATGDCCWEIESNDGDYEIVDPENPTDISIFYIYRIFTSNDSCPN